MKSKTALVTGSTRGIGFGIADALARKGFNLVLNGVRHETEVVEPVRMLRQRGVDVLYCQGSISDGHDRENIIAKAYHHFGSIHVLVNNAGVAPKKRNHVLELDETSYDYLLDTNLKGTFFMTQAVAKKMIAEKSSSRSFSGCIISITSVSAEVASINRGEYCISKAGLAMMTKLFAVALSEFQIPVYEVQPGIIETDMTAGVKEKYDKLIREGLTLEGRWGTPADIGTIVSALATGEIPYATGQVIHADGGMSVRRL